MSKKHEPETSLVCLRRKSRSVIASRQQLDTFLHPCWRVIVPALLNTRRDLDLWQMNYSLEKLTLGGGTEM